MNRKQGLFILFFVLAAAAGAGLYAYLGRTPPPPAAVTPEQNPPQAEASPAVPVADETQERVSEIIKEAWAQAANQNFDKALSLCDEAIQRYGTVAIPDSDTFMNYKDLLESEKSDLLCVKRHPTTRAMASEADLREALGNALRTADAPGLEALLPCGVWIGVPESEYEPDYEPEKTAKELIQLRVDEKSGMPLSFQYTESTELAEGFSDGAARQFQFEQEEKTKSWRIKSILYGDKQSIQGNP